MQITSTNAYNHYMKRGSTTFNQIAKIENINFDQNGYVEGRRYVGMNVSVSKVILKTVGPSAIQGERGYNTDYVLPIRGRSEVGGMVSATMFRKNVRESKTVTSRTNSCC